MPIPWLNVHTGPSNPCAAAATRALNAAAPTATALAAEAAHPSSTCARERAECVTESSRASICQGCALPPDGARIAARRRCRRSRPVRPVRPARRLAGGSSGCRLAGSSSLSSWLAMSMRTRPDGNVLAQSDSAGRLRRPPPRRARRRPTTAARSTASCPTSTSDAAPRDDNLVASRIRRTYGIFSRLVRPARRAMSTSPSRPCRIGRAAPGRTSRRPPGPGRWLPSAPAGDVSSRSLADEHFHVQRIAFLDDDVEAVEEFADGLGSDTRSSSPAPTGMGRARRSSWPRRSPCSRPGRIPLRAPD